MGACGGADASNACCDAKSSNPTCTALRSGAQTLTGNEVSLLCDELGKIQDAVYTTYSQSTLRYAAKLTLLAKLPGNGMGGALNTAAPKEGACGGADASNACCDAKSSNPTCTALRSGAQTLTGNEVSLLCDELGTKGQAPKNPKAKELLEGKAFFKVISGIMHNMRVPGVPPNPVHEASL